MEIRQVLMVALFMFAAAIMKNAMPGQAPIEVSPSVDIDAVGNQVEAPKMITALAPVSSLLAVHEDKPPVKKSDSPLSRKGFEATPIPGSFIALVVAAMGLVSVARRPL